uniref:SJCHGC09762 protein n=1 Tax=Schistosoma japonicum TaxID=6182 RepID=Q5BQX4_SCHJA|nr:SJCHGC09762 protein [Schistosoma japonicum]AAX31062.2 SJCHGC09772 protein [Schistosoma japonicum]
MLCTIPSLLADQATRKLREHHQSIRQARYPGQVIEFIIINPLQLHSKKQTLSPPHTMKADSLREHRSVASHLLS